MKLPDLTQQPVLHVNATPDIDYPLRILKAYRENCNCRWSSSTEDTEEKNPVLVEMNKLQDMRAQILDKAIEILQKEMTHVIIV